MKAQFLVFTLVIFYNIVFCQVNKNFEATTKSNEIYYDGCSEVSMGYYKPDIINSYNDLPKRIVRKIKKYMKRRVGKKLAKDFYLKNGRIIDLEELNRVSKGWGSYRATYDLCFLYKDLVNGITYASRVEFDEKGKTVEDIKFPRVNKKEKFKGLISFKRIKEIAKNKERVYLPETIVKKGEYVKYKTEINLLYDEDTNRLVWEFKNKTQKSDNIMLYDSYFFNAHNGEFIKKDTNEGTWID